jgi:hypothetical protein
MPVYKIYLVQDAGELATSDAFYCHTDEEAIARLKPPPEEDRRAELWQGGRFVALAYRRTGPDPLADILRA